MVKIDPYKHKEKYLNWKNKIGVSVPKISKENSELLLKYLNDMEIGINVSICTKKGPRGYVRLNTLKSRLIYLMIKFNERYNKTKITEIEEEQLHDFFSKMSNGEIRKADGTQYKAIADYVKILKSFLHWWIKVNRKKGIDIRDITLDLNTKQEKPDWVYLTEDQIKKLCNKAKYEYKVLIWFLFDTGIRAPTELMNIRVSDFYNDFKELQIREEISKTFGRRIKLMLCSDLIREYIMEKKLKKDDYLFKSRPWNVNRTLKRLAKNVLGDEVSPAGQKYSELTLYDFRHCSCCYWLPRYKSESALKYRFGWKKSDKIHYYSELLGMKDTINEDDLLTDITKSEMEKRLEKSEREKIIMQEQMSTMQVQFAEIAKGLAELKIMGVEIPYQSNK